MSRMRCARRSLRECSCSCSEKQPERTARRVLRLSVLASVPHFAYARTANRDPQRMLDLGPKIEPERGDILETVLEPNERKSRSDNRIARAEPLIRDGRCSAASRSLKRRSGWEAGIRTRR